MPRRLTQTDRKILAALQENGRMTNVELADRVGLSASPCLRRAKQLEADGIIQGYTAKIDRKSLGLGLEAFVSVTLERHRPEDVRAFREAVMGIREVVACYVMTGEMDFLLHVVCRDLESYGELATRTLLQVPGVKDTRSTFVLDTWKDPSGLPIDQQADEIDPF